jgi:hypothetical protein
MGADGTPILSDFGLARMLGLSNDDAATRLTMSGTTLGTAEYMAPEQVSNSNVGPAADIYAFAVIIYEMLTGSVPYSADTQLGVLMARVSEPVPLPRRRNASISEAVQDALLKGLAKNPADRYQSASDMVRALETATQRDVPPADRPLVRQNSQASAVSRKAILAVIMSAPFIAIIVVIILSKTYPAPPKSPPTTPAPAPTAAAPIEPPAKPGVESISPPTPTEVPTTPAPVAAAVQPVADRSPRSDGLPPHGKLLYSMSEHLSEIAAAVPQRAEDKVEVKGNAVELTAGSETGIRANLPVNGVGDFVAVMKYVSLSRRPSLRLRFHESPRGDGMVVRIPAFLRLQAPVAGASPLGPHPCCQDFDMFVAPQTAGSPAVFTGPPLLLTPPAANEEQTVAIAVKSSTIIVYAGGHEVARAADTSTATGGMTLVLLTERGQGPAVLRLNAFEIYDAPSTPAAARGSNAGAGRLPLHGKLLYSISSNLSDIAASRQQNSESTIAVKDGKLEFTAGEFGAFARLPISGIGDFVAVMRLRAVSKKPAFLLRFHRSGPAGEYVVQLPAYLRLRPPSPETPSAGPHTCCGDFDIMKAPTSPGTLTLFSGPPIASAAAAPNEELEFAVSVKGPVIVVYADGKEIARTSDTSFSSGAISFQVVGRGRENQFPAVLQLNALEIYEPSSQQ